MEFQISNGQLIISVGERHFWLITHDEMMEVMEMTTTTTGSTIPVVVVPGKRLPNLNLPLESLLIMLIQAVQTVGAPWMVSHSEQIIQEKERLLKDVLHFALTFNSRQPIWVHPLFRSQGTNSLEMIILSESAKGVRKKVLEIWNTYQQDLLSGDWLESEGCVPPEVPDLLFVYLGYLLMLAECQVAGSQPEFELLVR